jgi:hypothetical protein
METSTPRETPAQEGSADSPAQVNRSFGTLPLFDRAGGSTVVEPLGRGKGWWAGAPSALWTGSHYYLSYRLRQPQPERGGETRIAAGTDGVHFETIWSARKTDFGSPSIERCALVQAGDGWRLYVSYVDAADGKWRIDVLEASAPDGFDPARRRPILTAADIGAEGVKDPWVCRLGGEWLMLASYAPTPAHLAVDAAVLHATQDVYNTGHTKSLTGLASSADGLAWRWEGSLFEPRQSGWDSYAARLGTVVSSSPVWIGFYDGSGGVAENYEERCGVAYSLDLRHWRRVSHDGPAIGPNGGPGSVRYVEAVQARDWIRYYYEWTRPDGAHELRTSLVATR